MARLSKAHDQALRALTDLAAGGYRPDRLALRSMQLLQQAIGWAGYRVFALEPGSGLVNRVLTASEGDTSLRLDYLRSVYLGNRSKYEIANFSSLVCGPVATLAIQARQDECFGFPEDQLRLVDPADHERYFRLAHNEVGNAMVGLFRDGKQPVAIFQAYRKNTLPYRASDVEFLGRAGSVIGKALAEAIRREQEEAAARANEEPAEASGIVMIDRAGEISFATPAGERWLDELGYAQYGLPAGIWSAMVQLRARGGESSSVVTVPTTRSMLRIEASAGGHDDVTAVVMSQLAPPRMPEVPHVWGLTPQERQVVEQLALGLSNREIAAALFIGEHTVEWHLRKVFARLGVRSRNEVMTALFRQALPAAAS